MYTTSPTPPQALKIRLVPKTPRNPYPQISEGFKQYVQDISKHPRLAPEEERRLGKLARAGDDNALNELILSNLRLVISVARKYERTNGIPLEDLVGAGNTGLLRASESFDEKKARFSTYAVWWIRREIVRCINDHGHPVRIPENLGTKVAKVKKTTDKMRLELYREPKTWEIERETGLSNEAMDNIRWLSKPQMSLRDVASGGYSIEEEIPPDNCSSDEEMILEKIRDEELQEAMGKLTSQEASVLRMFYGFGENEGLTLQDIGKKLGISKERAWVLKDMAIAKLQAEMQGGLDAYV